ncbi:MAG TPA: hypothetical protein VL092_12080 [Chitinophagaceae bacterium]|nr:hypothetical protein [Chitinophagaceae bacterium]
MKIYPFFLFFLLPFGVFAQKDIAQKRTLYYNSGMLASAKSYDALLHAKSANNPDVYKIYEQQYALQQQRIAALADQWASGKYKGKNIQAALALLAKSDAVAAVKLMESKLKGRQKSIEEQLFLAELYEFSGDYDHAEKWSEGNEVSLEQGLYHAWLLALTGKPDLAGAQMVSLSDRFMTDTVGLARIKLQRSFIDTLAKNYSGAAAALIEAQYLLDKVQADSIQQYYASVVSGQLAQQQSGSGNVDNAYRNAQNSTAIADKIACLPLQAWAHHIMGQVYRKAGANQQADTQFRASIDVYTRLAAAYPQQYQPLLADVMNEYVEVLNWFDKKKEGLLLLEQIMAMRKSMAENKYPFFVLGYAGSIGRIADQYAFSLGRLDSAERVCKKQKEVLAVLYQQYPLLAGTEYASVLDKLGDISMTMKRYKDGIPYLTAALEVKQMLFAVYPEEHKQGLMNLLVRNATANGFYGNNIILAYQQLDRAAVLAAELSDVRVGQDIEKIKQRIPKK